MRRSRLLRGHTPVDSQTDPSHHYGCFGWNYFLPQNMTFPQRANRASPVPRSGGAMKARGVWIDTEMHPAFRVALDPYLKKLALTRVVPPTKAETAIADFKEVGTYVGDNASRFGYLAKVLQMCAMRKHNAGYDLWKEQCAALHVEGSEKPSAALARSLMYLVAETRHDEWKNVFKLCMKDKWNMTPRFCRALWNKVLRCAADKQDEEAFIMIMNEMHDVQVPWTQVSLLSLVTGFNNCITTDDGYVWMKKFLFNFEQGKTTSLAKYYTAIRSRLELKVAIPEARDPEEAEKKPTDLVFPENERVYYHVQWHNRIRAPMSFTPRQVYFDYFPKKTTDAIPCEGDGKKEKAADLVERKIKQFKAQGMLPEDYDFNKEASYTDYGHTFESFMRKAAPHKHRAPSYMRNHPGYDVVLAGKK